ncbi:MAG TPA: dihydropteroate synthase, partial [Solirubrobacteraceae bacterium]
MSVPERLTAPPRSLGTTAGTLELGGRPWLMGVVNATPDSFSDDGAHRTLDQRVELAQSLLDAGADIIDIGGESGRTDQPPVDAEEEIE